MQHANPDPTSDGRVSFDAHWLASDTDGVTVAQGRRA